MRGGWRFADVGLCLALLGLLYAVPDIDRQLAALFYVPGQGFVANSAGWARLVYHAVFKLTLVAAIVFPLLLLLSWKPGFPALVARRRAIAYLFAVLLLGPGLVVHGVFKDHWGRPRPRQTQEFGGQLQFTPAGVISEQKGASFVSGHAAFGFTLMAAYWLHRRRRWLLIGMATGLGIGVVRMAMGGHYLSDVLFAGFVVHFVARGLAAWLLPTAADPQ